MFMPGSRLKKARLFQPVKKAQRESARGAGLSEDLLVSATLVCDVMEQGLN
jgi:hypothetical protein